jgi:hypothetical protein
VRGTRRPSDGGGDVRAWLSGQSSCPLTSYLRKVPWDPMSDLGRYGTLAERHMARWLPSTYAAIPADQRAEYFKQLDEEVTNAIRAREHFSRPPASLQETNFAEYVGQMNMAHLMAEEAVLAEMVYLPPEPGLESEAGEPERDETGAFIDRGWKPPSLIEISDEEWAEQLASGDWQPLRRPRPARPATEP